MEYNGKHPKWMEIMDYFFNKVLPKKFIVIVVASIGLFMSLLTGGQWLIIAGAYAGINYGQKILEKVSGNRIDYYTRRGGGDRDTVDRGDHLDGEESREEAEPG